MSLSSETRRKDAMALLVALYEQLRDEAFDCVNFDCDDPSFNRFRRTSWDELVSEGLLRVEGAEHSLTARGWLEAACLSGDFASAETDRRVSLLFAALKNKLERRKEAAKVLFDDLATECGLPRGWLFNAIDAHLLQLRYKRQDASWVEGRAGRLILVPPSFGLLEIDLSDDVRAENIRLKEDLERAEELYSDYRCGQCSAPLAYRTPFEHEYGSDEVAEYECGMTVGAPYGDVPCTKDPRFPKFEDYVLNMRTEHGIWWCFAQAATPRSTAGLVMLPQAHGRTEQEAREAMRRNYVERAKPWKAR